ncbi:MAG: lipid IV(A) 3-deoxy-D-manno-octulosonic acid transferase [Gammaproteobacteria bacterium]|nr:lipid IV(A) 3-deoxy-D-manno-octulosonic acid transferase [Gammaproteobacteria bacterium]
MNISRGIYSLIMYLMVPLFIWRLIRRGFNARDYWQRWGERFGYSDQPELMDSIWVHAVSVGEVQAAVPLVKYYLEQENARPVVVTTMTPTGSSRVKKLFGDRVHHVYAPYDLPDAVSRFLNRINPVKVIVMETEIWPNMITWCYKRNVPLILANARLSERSARGYRRVPRLGRLALRRIRLIAAQSEDDAQRLISIGAEPEQIMVTGSIKMDVDLPASLREQGEVLRRRLGMDRAIWVAASTHEGEEEQVLRAYKQVRQNIPGCLLVLVPRHPERADVVETLCQRESYEVLRRSIDKGMHDVKDIYLVDTLGELTQFFAACDVAYIGGSLVPIGGHNMIEASALGVAVVFGPHLFNFQEISTQLLEADAARIIHDSDALAGVMTELLDDANLRHQLGENGKHFIESNRGALRRLIELVESC